MMSLTVLVSFESSEKELIILREPQISSPSLLFSAGANDLDERLTCWSETRRLSELGADAWPQIPGVRCGTRLVEPLTKVFRQRQQKQRSQDTLSVSPSPRERASELSAAVVHFHNDSECGWKRWDPRTALSFQLWLGDLREMKRNHLGEDKCVTVLACGSTGWARWRNPRLTKRGDKARKSRWRHVDPRSLFLRLRSTCAFGNTRQRS